MSDVLTEKEVTEFKDIGADEQLVLTEEFERASGEQITRTTEVARLNDGGMCLSQKDQTFEQVYLSQEAMDAVLSYLGGESDGV